MKKRFVAILICALLSFSMVLAPTASAVNKATDTTISLVTDAIKYINDENTDSYISLFDSENQRLMNDFVTLNPNAEMFQEDKIELVDIERLSYATGLSVAGITCTEVELYENIVVYLTKENITAKTSADRIETGISYKVYVIGYENDEPKIIRISQPVIGTTDKCRIKVDTFETAALNSGGNSRVALFMPSTIHVYFTKEANRTAHGATSDNIIFANYVKNVLPNEFIVSYYSTTPEYLKAGALVIKNYAWNNIVTPKRNYAPYYSDVLDNSQDQEYLATSYNSLAYTYQIYVNQAYDAISNIVMVKNIASGGEEYVIESQYRDSGYYEGSGILNQADALYLGNIGYSYQDIIRYYYDGSYVVDGGVVYFRAHN